MGDGIIRSYLTSDYRRGQLDAQRAEELEQVRLRNESKEYLEELGLNSTTSLTAISKGLAKGVFREEDTLYHLGRYEELQFRIEADKIEEDVRNSMQELEKEMDSSL